jgi:hypothetical protein
VSKSMHAEQGEPSPYNRQLQQFLTFLQTRERVRRRHDCQPQTFAETLLSLAGRTRHTAVHRIAGGPYQVLHQCRGGQVEADQRVVPCTVSALVFSLCQQSRLVRGGHRRVHRRTPALHSRESSARAVVGRGEEASYQRQRHVASSDQESLRNPVLLGLRSSRWRSLSLAS